VILPHEVRFQYGRVYVTSFPDGLSVPWRPLTVQEYIEYSKDTERGVYLPVYIEDEMFQKCVVDESLRSLSGSLKAGVISTVAVNIWQISGPTSVEAFNEDLETAREQINQSAVTVIHELVQLITLAFPYTPEQIYQMDYETFVSRVIQAENKLLQTGMIQEPIRMSQKGKQPRKRPLRDLKKVFEQQQRQEAPVPSEKTEDWWKKTDHGIDFGTEGKEQEVFGVHGHDKLDLHIAQDKMVKEAQVQYADVLEKLRKKREAGAD
jgi:hypothetical protein